MSTSVLLVEPDVDNRDLYDEYLTMCGFRVEAVANLAEALRRSTRVDVIVSGIRPRAANSGGWNFIGQLRALQAARSTPVVVVSACAFQVDQDAAEAAGCDAFLRKPCLPDALVERIRAVVPTVPEASTSAASCPPGVIPQRI
jgi:CheY-like chemotaxis protein